MTKRHKQVLVLEKSPFSTKVRQSLEVTETAEIHRGSDTMSNHEEASCEVDGATSLVLRIARWCGLAPLNLNKVNGHTTITVSQRITYAGNILCALLCLSSMSALVLDLCADTSKAVRVSSSMTAAVFVAEMLLVNGTVILGIVSAPARMRQLINIKKTIAQIELTSGNRYSICSQRKFCFGIILFMISFICLLGSDYYANVIRALTYNKDWVIAYMYVSFFLQYGITFVLQLQFVMGALSIQISIQAMNDSFEQISENLYYKAMQEGQLNPINQIEKSMGCSNVFAENLSLKRNKKSSSATGKLQISVQPHETINRLASLHCLLCDLVQQMNDRYGFLLIAILLSFLIHLIMSPYYLILQLQDSQKRISKLCLQLLWCIFHTFDMFMLVEPCHRTIKEFNRTQELVSRLIRRMRPYSGHLAVQLDMFSRQLLLRTSFYSPLGMCKLDRPLITSIIGGVTTYLVILIQFQQYTGFNATGNV